MARYVLRYRGEGPAPARDVEQVAEAGARVVDRAGRMLLVDVDEQALAGLLASLPGWVAAPEQSYRNVDGGRG